MTGGFVGGGNPGARFDTVGTGRRVGAFSRSGAVDQVVNQSIGWSAGGEIGWLGVRSRCSRMTGLMQRIL